MNMVMNLKGTTKHRSLVPWLHRYQDKQPNDDGMCAVVGCRKPADCGAHVVEYYDRLTPQIIPLCAKHNQTNDKWLRVSKEPIPIREL